MDIPKTVLVPLRIYVACKLTEDSESAVKANADKGLDLAVRVWELGHYPFSPIGGVPTIYAKEHYDQLSTAGTNGGDKDVDEAYRRVVWGYDGDYLRMCDGILLGPGWKLSRGCGYEKFMAEEWGMWIFYSIDELPEVNRDEDAVARMEELDEQYMRKRRQLLASAERGAHRNHSSRTQTAHDEWVRLMGGK